MQNNPTWFNCTVTGLKNTYTSKERIKWAVNLKELVEETVYPESAKRTCSSLGDSLFGFKKHCIFCGTECFEKGHQNPARLSVYWGQLLEQTKVHLLKIIFYKSVLCGKIASLLLLNILLSQYYLIYMQWTQGTSRLQEILFSWWMPQFRDGSSSQKKKDYVLLDVIKTMDEDKSVSCNSMKLEPEFWLCWIKLCSSDNHYTTAPLKT